MNTCIQDARTALLSSDTTDRGTTSLTATGPLPFAKGSAPASAAHYCCDGLTRPVLLARARTVATKSPPHARVFFRKLTGDGRVKAATSMVPEKIVRFTAPLQ
ncbi:hypothetical protein NicSoilC12_36170 [Arthrobacter sp. NicSoilC12]|nr:hypothetical protein NicSoilC12_36170 [Arthrobacter sp. NicSoilC12]